MPGEQGIHRRGRANGQPLLGILLTDLELLPRPNSRREDVNVLLCSWWRPKGIWSGSIPKHQGEGKENRICYLPNTCRFCIGRLIIEVIRGQQEKCFWLLTLNNGNFLRPKDKITISVGEKNIIQIESIGPDGYFLVLLYLLLARRVPLKYINILNFCLCTSCFRKHD